MKVTDFCLKEEHRCYIPGSLDPLILPAGAYVKPIHDYWLPKHVKESPLFKFYDNQKEMACYTRFGIMPIPLKLLRER